MRRLSIALLAVLSCCLAAVAPAALADNPVVPKATTGAATGVGVAGATVAATVDPQGSSTSVTFEYGTSSAYGLSTAAQDVGAGGDPVGVTATLAKLSSDTTYHYRVVATNAAGVTRGADRSLRTAKTPRAPTIGSGVAKEVGTGSATLTGTVDAQGLSTTVSVEYGTSTRYGASAGATALDGFGSKAIALPVTGLAPYTKYYYRLVAVNEKGTTRGASRSFTTLRAPTGIELTSVPAAVGWGATATLAGRVQGAGISRIGIRVERTDFPFSRTTTKDLSTASDGSFSTAVGPLWVTTRLRVLTRATVVAVSPTVTVNARLKVGMKVGARTRRTVTLTGAIQPGVPQGVVSIQRRSADGTRWVRVARSGVTVRSTYASRYRLEVRRTRGPAVFRAVVAPHDGGAHAAGTSHELRVAGRGR